MRSWSRGFALKHFIKLPGSEAGGDHSGGPAWLPRVDSHQHFWNYHPEEFSWLEGALACLQRDYCVEDLLSQMHSAHVSGAVAVQARQSQAETSWLLDLADRHSEIVGVVGWLPIAAKDFPSLLEQVADRHWLKGLRHVVQAEATGFLAGADFEHGIRHLLGTDLVYDILIHKHQMLEVIAFVDRHPQQSFVLDHLAKSRIADREFDPWRQNLQEFAKRPNVTCKISGMVTEAGCGWTPDDLMPYFEVALEAFTPARLMAGSDWPVLTAHCTYKGWWQIVAGWVSSLSQNEQADILAGTAMRVYDLHVDTR